MVTHLLQRRPPLRVAYNGSMFALSALAGGARGRPASTGTRPRASSRRSWSRVPLLLGRQPHPDQRHPRGELRQLVLHDREGEHHADDRAVRAHGLGRAHPCHPLAARSRCSRSRSPARCSRSRSTSARRYKAHAGDATRPDRSAHGSRQPPQLPRAPAAGARRGRARGHVGRALPLRPRRPQERQRPPRPSRRRSRARPGRVAAATGRRGVPARWRRVRGAPATAGRAAGERCGTVDRRAHRGTATSRGSTR